MARTRRQGRAPALGGSVALHAGVLLAGWLLLRHAVPPLQLAPEPVAVTVVSSAPPGLASPAVEAPEPAPAQSPEPAAEPAPPAEVESPAPPKPSPPPPAPAPAARAQPPPTPRPAPVPKPTPKPAPLPKSEPKPAPKPVAKAPPKPDLNLDALASSLPKTKARPQRDLDLSALASSLPSARPSHKAGAGALDLAALADSLPAGSRRAAGAKGAARPETAREARTTAGSAPASMTANQLGAISDGLNRHFNKNWCVLDGAKTIAVSVRMQLDAQGGLASTPEVVSATGQASPQLLQVVGERAITAARLAAPFPGINKPLDVRIRLTGKVLCNG